MQLNIKEASQALIMAMSIFLIVFSVYAVYNHELLLGALSFMVGFFLGLVKMENEETENRDDSRGDIIK